MVDQTLAQLIHYIIVMNAELVEAKRYIAFIEEKTKVPEEQSFFTLMKNRLEEKGENK